MNAYITGQITGKERTDISVIKAMVDVAEAKGISVYFPERDTNKGELDRPDIIPEEIYAMDSDAVKKSELIIVECSNPSTGNGMEIMLAYLFDRKIICVCKKGVVVSRMLLGMPGVEFVVYEDIEDLKGKINKVLETLEII